MQTCRTVHSLNRPFNEHVTFKRQYNTRIVIHHQQAVNRQHQCIHITNIGQYRTIQDNTGQYRTIQDNTGQYRTIQGQYTGSVILPNQHLTFILFHGLYSMHSLDKSYWNEAITDFEGISGRSSGWSSTIICSTSTSSST